MPGACLRLEKLKKIAYKFTPETLSEKIFQLPAEYKGIINHIAKNGPSILNEITEQTENLGRWKCSRKAAKIRIKGSPQNFGMIECEYLIAKDPKSNRHGNAKDVYFLTTKGMLAALSTGLDIDEIYLYRRYVDLIYKRLKIKIKRFGMPEIKGIKLNDEKMINIVNGFIKSKINIFLLWHYVCGIQLQKQIGTQAYFIDFFRNTNEYFHGKFPKISDEELEKFSISVLRDNFVYSRTLHALDAIADTSAALKFPNENESVNQQVFEKVAMISQYVWQWPYYMEKMQLIRKNMDSKYSTYTPPNFHYKPNDGIDISTEIVKNSRKMIQPRLFLQVKTDLTELGIDENYAEEVLKYIWDEPHDTIRIMETNRVQR
jgi:hypothetical protein